MKNKEFIIMATGSILLLGFVIFLLIHSYNSSKTFLIREDLKNDKLIIEEINKLKKQDTFFIYENKKVANELIKINSKLKRLERAKPLVVRDSVFIFNNY